MSAHHQAMAKDTQVSLLLSEWGNPRPWSTMVGKRVTSSALQLAPWQSCLPEEAGRKQTFTPSEHAVYLLHH